MGVSPFDPGLLRLNIAQLDFILEMHALDNPKTARFTRPSSPKLTDSQIAAAWSAVKMGGAKQNFMSRFGGGQAMQNLRKWMGNNKRTLAFHSQRAKK